MCLTDEQDEFLFGYGGPLVWPEFRDEGRLRGPAATKIARDFDNRAAMTAAPGLLKRLFAGVRTAKPAPIGREA